MSILEANLISYTQNKVGDHDENYSEFRPGKMEMETILGHTWSSIMDHLLIGGFTCTR